MKHALVTGGTGFIGSHLVDSLLARLGAYLFQPGDVPPPWAEGKNVLGFQPGIVYEIRFKTSMKWLGNVT